MQSKFGLVALSVMATLVLFGGNTAEAKSNTTEKNEAEKAAAAAETKAAEAEKPVVVTIKEGDTLADIAAGHNTSYVRLYNANDKIANPDMIYVGDSVRIPKEDEQLPDRFSQLAPAVQAEVIAADVVGQTTTSAQPTASAAPVRTTSYRGSSAGNTYGYGWCTWYAKSMRPDLPNNLGNGGSWVANASAQGIPTGSVARAGAVAEIPGHVAYVESVSGGMMTISEMGWNYQQGQFNRRTVPAAGWLFIY
ncbi:MAG: peptidoglycan DL-endopeptidase CwlO [Patescibacteria group bacterium]|jgi:surface antigen|nr:peptidoglycan DL-endopeptidase CwlO [Patescibacteria group bacterium]